MHVKYIYYIIYNQGIRAYFESPSLLAANRPLGPPLFRAKFRARFLNGFSMVLGSFWGGIVGDFLICCITCSSWIFVWSFQ